MLEDKLNLLNPNKQSSSATGRLWELKMIKQQMKLFEAELKVQSQVNMTCDPCLSTWTVMEKYYFVSVSDVKRFEEFLF